MKLRNAVAATLGALALTLSMSGSAFAAEGEFHYTYKEEDGQVREAPSATRPTTRASTSSAPRDEIPAGYGPQNSTDSYVILYLAPTATRTAPRRS